MSLINVKKKIKIKKEKIYEWVVDDKIDVR